MDEIIKSGNHYLIKVKGNQPKLKSAIEAVLSKGHPTGSYRTQEQIRGRLEIRKTSSSANGILSPLSFHVLNLYTFLPESEIILL